MCHRKSCFPSCFPSSASSSPHGCSTLIRKALGITSADPENHSLAQTFDPADQVTIATPDEKIHPVWKDIHKLYDDLMAKKSPEQVCGDAALTRLLAMLEAQRQMLTTSRTAKLWFQYLDMIMKMLIKAEWLGNWYLHRKAVREMLPYLASSGHNMYAKSARMYLQSMLDLEKEHPDVLQRFKDGFHVCRRSNRSWAGFSTDLMIEQVLMRSIKTSGGQTRGRGMTEQQRLIWLLSMPACAEVNRAMQELTSVKYDASEQSKEMLNARQQRDLKNTETLMMALSDRSPFHDNPPQLKNIMTGIHAGEVSKWMMPRLLGTA